MPSNLFSVQQAEDESLEIIDLEGKVVGRQGWHTSAGDDNQPKASLSDEGILSASYGDSEPIQVYGVTQFAGATEGILFLKSDGILYGFGYTNPDGQLAHGVQNTPGPGPIQTGPKPSLTLVDSAEYPDNKFFHYHFGYDSVPNIHGQTYQKPWCLYHDP